MILDVIHGQELASVLQVGMVRYVLERVPCIHLVKVAEENVIVKITHNACLAMALVYVAQVSDYASLSFFYIKSVKFTVYLK